MNFSSKLLVWYSENQRDLPWRKTQNPYFIWVSEIILQQTRVEQGLPYYYTFISNFPNLAAFANAPLDDVLRIWQGLGYYSRARNMHNAAQQIMNDWNGEFPNTFEQIMNLKGVGKYTASAIASFAFGKYTPVVDGNVIRLVSRYLGIYANVERKENANIIENFVLQEIQKVESPDLFNQAVMEFGALFCTPKNPNCINCIFITECVAYVDEKIESTPLKTKLIKKQKRFFHYLFFSVIKNSVLHTFIEKRLEKDIWQNLYELPLLELENAKKADLIRFFNLSHSFDKIIKKHSSIIHPLSHRELYITFWECDASIHEIPDNIVQKYEIVSLENLTKIAFPIPLVRYISLKKELSKNSSPKNH